MKRLESKFWLMGFLGFLSLQYLSSKNIGDLWFLSFFGFFAYYFIDKIGAKISDEMLLEHSYKAKSATMYIPLVAISIIGFLLAQNLLTKEVVVFLLALTFSSTLIAYAFLFYYFEKN